jgi:hypothetical protein
MHNLEKIKKGSAIAYGLVMITVISIILVSVIQFIASNMRYAAYAEDKERAFHIAESGIYFYRWYLAHEIELKDQNGINDFWNGNPLGVDDTYVKDYLDNSQEKIGQVEIDVTFPTAGDYNIVQVSSTGYSTAKPNIKRTIQATLRRSLWSDFTVISDSIVCFDKYWTINGKVMGNSGVHFDGVANNIVMAGVPSYDDNNSFHTDYGTKDGVWTSWAYDAGHGCYYNTEKSSCVFNAGTQYPVPKKNFTGVTAYMQSIRTEAKKPGGATVNACTSTGCYFDNTNEGRQITLKSNGTFDMCPVYSIDSKNYPKKYAKIGTSGTCNDCSGACLATFNIPSNGVIFVEDNIWLSGTISNKRVTLAAASVSDPGTSPNIYITNNVKYTNKDGSDALGILAEGNIEILENAPNDLEIDGGILAQNGMVTKPEYNHECCGGGCTSNKNYINIFGCVITKGGLDITPHKGTCPQLELERVITYDNNLYTYPPPFFPADSFYAVDNWKEL